MDQPTSNRKLAQNIRHKRMLPWWLLSGMLVSLGSQASEEKIIDRMDQDQGLEDISSVDSDTEASSLLSLGQSTHFTRTSVNPDMDGELLVESLPDEEEVAWVETEKPTSSSVAYMTVVSSENEALQNEMPGVIEVMTAFAAGVFFLGTRIADNHISQELPEDQNSNVDEYYGVEYNGGGSSNQILNKLTLWAGYPGAFDPAMYDVSAVKPPCKDSLLCNVKQFNDHYKTDGMEIGKVIGYMSSPETDTTDTNWKIFEPSNVVTIVNAFYAKGIEMDIQLDYASFTCGKKAHNCGEYQSNNVTKTSSMVNELTNADWNSNPDPKSPLTFDTPTPLHSALQWFADVVNDSSLNYIPALVIDPEAAQHMETQDIQQLIYYIDEFRYNYTYDKNPGKYFELGMTIDHASKSQTYGNVTSFPSRDIDKNLNIYSLEVKQGSLINNKGELIYRISSQPKDKPAQGEEPLVNDMYLQMYARDFDYWMKPLQGETIDCGDSAECLNMALREIPIMKSKGGLTKIDITCIKSCEYKIVETEDETKLEHAGTGAHLAAKRGVPPGDGSYSIIKIENGNVYLKGNFTNNQGNPADPFENASIFYMEESPTKYVYPPVINQDDVENIYMMFSFEGYKNKQFFVDSTGKPLDPTSFQTFLDGFVKEYTGNEFYMYQPVPGTDLKPITNPIKSASGGSDVDFLKDNFAIFEYKWLFEDPLSQDPDKADPDWFGPFP